MPRTPKWLADTFEKISSKFYHSVQVTHIETYSDLLKKIRFEGEIKGVDFIPGNVVEFRINDTDFRHYTPSLLDTDKNICEIIFYLHGKGVGSLWVENLKVGDTIKLIGPGGRMSYQSDFKQHFVFGDETSLGLMLCMEQEALKKQHSFFGLAELEKEHLNWINYLKSNNIKSTESDFENPAQPTIDLLNQWEDFFEKKNSIDMCFYLTGRAKSIQKFRKFLISKGISNKQIRTYPYWAEGKKGL